jgi:hypothetical protein
MKIIKAIYMDEEYGEEANYYFSSDYFPICEFAHDPSGTGHLELLSYEELEMEEEALEELLKAELASLIDKSPT